MSLDPSAAVPPGDDAFVLTRVFAAPAAPVFTAWTDPAELLAWFGPPLSASSSWRPSPMRRAA